MQKKKRSSRRKEEQPEDKLSMAAATPPWTSRLRNYIRGAVDETLFRLQYTIAEVWSTSELLDSVWREQDNIEPSRGDEDATRNGCAKHTNTISTGKHIKVKKHSFDCRRGDEAQRSDYSLPALQSFEVRHTFRPLLFAFFRFECRQ